MLSIYYLHISQAASLSIKIEPQTKAELQNNLIPEIPNARTRAILKRAKKNRQEGKSSPMFTDDEELIKKDPKKYRHIDTMIQWFHEQGI